MKYLTLIFCIFSLSLFAACGSKLFTVHKIDVQQGNALDMEMVEKIELGMTREQVQYVLGSPLITDSFHPDRWDYIYLFTPGYGEKQRRQLTLTFDRDEVIDIKKHNIVKDDSLAHQKEEEIKTQKAKQAAKKPKNENLTTKEKKELEELEELEKQATTLEETLETNKNPEN